MTTVSNILSILRITVVKIKNNEIINSNFEMVSLIAENRIIAAFGRAAQIQVICQRRESE